MRRCQRFFFFLSLTSMKNYENGRIIVAFAVVVIVVGTAAAAVAADTHTQYINDKMSQRKQEEVKINEREGKTRKKRNIIPYLIDVSCQLREFLYMFVMLLSDNEEQKSKIKAKAKKKTKE